jgi:hypothetical protein
MFLVKQKKQVLVRVGDAQAEKVENQEEVEKI